ncbi:MULTISPECIES: MFS transporter [unclassified Crossiella]|uniref:MFS transporter n=1 Tax=unclassified Crossiella TaxID=2620835 RepID=UPI001FFF6A1E|nr:MULTISPECIES: MFS transporter [unclassified Crossiella]MCK2242530.1 MFS transporter [Crossiella sp. S99.2]MCK2254440.1 MFS transporter [Crossiella sp. S99.1]
MIVGIVLAALNLRPAVTSLAAVLAEVRDSLGVSAVWVSAVTAVPTVCFGFAGLVAPTLARRFGALRVVGFALALLGLGLALRVLDGPAVLLGGTLAACSSIAVANVLIPVVVKESFPGRLGFVMGVYSAALSAGGAAAAAFTAPLERWVGGWRLAVGLWAGLAVIAVIVWAVARRRAQPLEQAALAHDAEEQAAQATAPAAAATPDVIAPATIARPTDSPAVAATSATVQAATDQAAPAPAAAAPAAASTTAAAGRTTSLFRNPLAWAVTGFFGIQSLVAYTWMGWLPEILRDVAGVDPTTAGVMLGALMVIGVPAALIIPPLVTRRRAQSGWAVAMTATSLLGVLGLLLLPTLSPVLWVVLLGVGMGGLFPLALTFITLRSRTVADTAELSAMAQSLGYLIAAIGPFGVGMLHGWTGGWTASLLLVLLAMTIQLLIGYLAGRPRYV